MSNRMVGVYTYEASVKINEFVSKMGLSTPIVLAAFTRLLVSYAFSQKTPKEVFMRILSEAYDEFQETIKE